MSETPIMAGWPLATRSHYRESFAPLPKPLRLRPLLARASRKLRAECPCVDADIAAGALDPDLVADIVCEMVERATRQPGGMDGEVKSYQQGAGPYQATITFADAVGRLFLSKEARRLLGCGRQTAFTVSMTTGEV